MSTQSCRRLNQAGIVMLVKSNARFIKNIEHSCQPGDDLGCQVNTLRLTARKTGCCPVQCQVIQAHIQQELQACRDLFEQLARYQTFAFCQCHLDQQPMRNDGSLSIRHEELIRAPLRFAELEKPLCLFNGELCHLRNIAPTNCDGQCFWLESSATTIRADAYGYRAFNLIAPGRRRDRKSTRLNSSHLGISYADFCLKKKNN